MIVLDYQDRRPIYEQVAEKLRRLILSGVLAPADKMPSVRQLAMDLAVNPNTIQRAYTQLEQEGLIYPVKGRGNFVADSADILRVIRANCSSELKTQVMRARTMGFEEEEVIDLVRECYKEGNQG